MLPARTPAAAVGPGSLQIPFPESKRRLNFKSTPSAAVIYTLSFAERNKQGPSTFHGLLHREPHEGCKVVGNDGGVGLRDQGEGPSPGGICRGGGRAAHSEPRGLAFCRD